MERHLRLNGYAPSTRQGYARSLRDAQDWLDAKADDFTSDDILLWLAHLQQRVGPSALNVNACALKYYFSEILDNPEIVRYVPTPRKAQQLGELLTTSELRELFGAAINVKHRLVLALLFGLGLRAGEVGTIRLHDFDREHRTLIIRHAKGGKHRIVPYDDAIRRLLIAYFREHQPDDFLFTSATRKADGGGISTRGVQYIVNQTLAKTNIRKKVCPHTLRHCFAVHYLNHGGNLIRLKQLLGHAYLTTTLRYLSYASPELKDIPSPYAFILDA